LLGLLNVREREEVLSGRWVGIAPPLDPSTADEEPFTLDADKAKLIRDIEKAGK
jgi:hypothetical protein